MWKMCITAVAMCLVMANAALAAELKIGIVDMREILTNSEPAKRAKATMDSKFGAERDRLEKQEQDLQKQRDSLNNPAPNQTREAFEQRRAEFIRKRQEQDKKVNEFSERVGKEEEQLRNNLLELVFKAAQDLAVKRGLTYFVDAGSGIIYADPSMVMTKEFMDEVNRQWKEKPSAPSGGGKKRLPLGC